MSACVATGSGQTRTQGDRLLPSMLQFCTIALCIMHNVE